MNALTIDGNKNGDTLKVSLCGRLDTNTFSELEKYLNDNLDGVKSLVFDLKNLEYISSAGLRVLLSAQKLMNGKKYDMLIKNPCETVSEIFAATGLVGVFKIE